MLNPKNVDKIVFIDIETTSQHPTFFSMEQDWKDLFMRRFKKDIEEGKKCDEFIERDNDWMENLYNTKAPLHPEFGKIVCISCGILTKDKKSIKIVHYADADERVMLIDFLSNMDKVIADPKVFSMAAHNGKMFDFPFIAKRIIINQLILPEYFNFATKKPWDVDYLIDTKVIWQFGVYDNSASLEILCKLFSIPTSKDDIHGSQVKNIFWIDNDIERIAKYCDKDVYALARVYLVMNGIYEVPALM